MITPIQRLQRLIWMAHVGVSDRANYEDTAGYTRSWPYLLHCALAVKMSDFGIAVRLKHASCQYEYMMCAAMLSFCRLS